jgi:hypothetical protein
MKLGTNLAMVHEAHPTATSGMDSEQSATARDIANERRCASALDNLIGGSPVQSQ